MLTKGAIGNLVNRYRAVLKKCNLINVFGSLAVASMLVMGGVSVANAETVSIGRLSTVYDDKQNADYADYNIVEGNTLEVKNESGIGIYAQDALSIGEANTGTLAVTSSQVGIQAVTEDHVITADTVTVDAGGNALYVASGSLTIDAKTVDFVTDGNGIQAQGGAVTIKNAELVNITAESGRGIRMAGDSNSDVSISAKDITIYAPKSGESSVKNGSASTLILDADNSVTLTGDVIMEGNGDINISSVSATTINGNVLSKGYAGTTNISSDADTVINGSVKITNPNTNGGGNAGGDIINVTGKNITIDGGSDYAVSVRGGYAGFGKPTAANIGTADTESVTLKGLGIISQYEDSDINIYGKELTIEAKDSYGIYTGNNSACFTPSAEVNIYSDQTKIDMVNGGNALVAFSQSTLNVHGGLETVNSDAAIFVRGNSTVKVNEDGNGVVKLNGDIVFHSQGTGTFIAADNSVTVNLTTPDSYLDGKIEVRNSSSSNQSSADVGVNTSGMTLKLANGATWYATGDSFANQLEMNEGILDIKGAHDVDVTNALSGTGGTIKTVVENGEATGSLNVAKVAENSTPSFSVVPVNANGETLTADDISATQLKSVIEQAVTSPDEEVANQLVKAATASTVNGIVNNGITVDGNGNIVSGGGVSSVTKAVLEAASVNTVALDRILTNDVRKRLGDIRSDANQTGVWMRWDGGKLKGNGLTNDFNTIQIGGDTKVAKNCRLGVAGSFTHGDGDFDRGSSELEGFSFAAYATWMGENGMFADIVARLGHFSTEMNVEGQSGDMNNRVASLSGEYGWRFNLCDQFFIEPQIELAYTYVSSEDLELDTAKFSFDNVESLTGRAGLVAGWNLPNEMGNVYARASVVQQFMGDAKVTGYSGVGPTVHETDGDDTWLEYGIGANIKLTDKTYIWADVERTEGADIEEEWRGTVGVRFSF